MTLPETMTIEGVRYKRLDRIANRVSTYAMYDCHLFRQLEGTTIDEVIADWQRECAAPDARTGQRTDFAALRPSVESAA